MTVEPTAVGQAGAAELEGSTQAQKLLRLESETYF